jgi:hypothetical protein
MLQTVSSVNGYFINPFFQPDWIRYCNNRIGTRINIAIFEYIPYIL